MPLFSYTYSLPYVLLFFILLILLVFELRLRMINASIAGLRILTILLFLIFLGLRGHLMTDWVSYYPYFVDLPILFDESFFLFVNNYSFLSEPLFGIYSIIFKTLINDYYAWVFFNVLVDILILDWFFHKYSSLYILSFMLFFVFGGAGLEINMLRNIKSICLFILSIPYLQNRKLLPYMLINSLGFMFHVSSILFLPFYLIANLKLSNKIIWSIFIIGNLIFLLELSFIMPVLKFFGGFIGGRLEHIINAYSVLELYNKSYGFSVGFLERNVTFLIFACNYNRIIREFPFGRIFFNMYVLYFITFMFFSEMSVISERIPNLFVCSYWILYPNLLNLVSNIIVKKIFLYYLLALLFMKIITGFSNVLCRYDNLLWGTLPYSERFMIFRKSVNDIIK